MDISYRNEHHINSLPATINYLIATQTPLLCNFLKHLSTIWLNRYRDTGNTSQLFMSLWARPVSFTTMQPRKISLRLNH